MNDITELRENLKKICEENETQYSGIEKLLKYYTEKCKWPEEKAIDYIIELFHNGIIDQIKDLSRA